MATTTTVHPWVASHKGRIGFGIQMPPPADWATAKDIAQAAEQFGFETLWIPDHPLLGSDSWTRLAALADVTKRVRLGTMVSCVYYRNPVQLARAVADVDRMSGGRVVLGIGSGDLPWEFEQMGLTFPPPAERAAVLEEALQVVPPLLRGEEVHFAGEHFQVKGAALRPPAAQQPYVPVLVAGGGAKTTLRLTALYADGNNMAAASWAGGAFTPDDVKAKFEVLRQRCHEAGRSYDAILRTTQVGYYLANTEAEVAAVRDAVTNDPVRGRIMQFLERVPMFCTPAQAIDHLSALREAGFQHFIVNGSDSRSIENFASKVMRPLLDRVA
jgi:alkanesulfonate monooxygenase SsuD/methylene tetrahydromethanopterin reductase-like flavin-dependent oxidoreductase (luciferase family)